MKLQALSLCVFACTACAFDVDDFLDRLDTALSVSAFHDNLRVRLSGTLDLEIYNFEQPAPGLIDSSMDTLFNPRLTLFLDAQIGSQIYFFAQSRLDRGFDPSDHGAQVRLDEYALRATPWQDSRFTVQIGKFATVVGNWVPRHLSWDNPFINGPLVYENVTAIQDKYAAFSPLEFLYGPYYEGKYAFNPVIWGPSYASGISVSGQLGKFDYAVEMKNASLSSRPESWYVTENGFENPTFSGRAGFRPNQAWNFGPSSTKPASKCLEWETQTHSLITSKRSTNLPRNYSARFAGISSSSARSAMATAITLTGVQTSAGSTSLWRGKLLLR